VHHCICFSIHTFLNIWNVCFFKILKYLVYDTLSNSFLALFFQTGRFGIHVEAIVKWLRELFVESGAYLCIYLWNWFSLCLSREAYILAYWGGRKVHPLCLMKFVELETSDSIRQEVMTSEAQEKVPVKISWPRLRLCNITYDLWNCCLMLSYCKCSWRCILWRSKALNLVIITFR